MHDVFIVDTGRIKASIHNSSGCALHNSGEAGVQAAM